MRRLILLRHAKSSWDDPALHDAARPLNPRGRRDAPRMGAWLAAQGIKPDLVLVSTAIRTRETWRLFAPELNACGPAQFRDDLYHAQAIHIIEIARETPGAVETLLLIGHNSGLENAAAALTGYGDDAKRNAMAAKFPSAGLAVIDLETSSWRDIATGKGHLQHFVTPKSLE